VRITCVGGLRLGVELGSGLEVSNGGVPVGVRVAVGNGAGGTNRPRLLRRRRNKISARRMETINLNRS
jgi:hypothetical protein